MDPMDRRALTLGIVGFGYAGKQLARSAEAVPDVRVTAVAETDPATEAVDGEVELFRDWRQLLRRPDVQAVAVCLPHFLHAEVASAVLDAGKHLLIEKPLAHRLREAEQIVHAAERSGLVTIVEMTHRFYPPVQQARELLRSGRMGRIYAVEDRIVERVPPGGLPSWIFQREVAGGGVALTAGIHMLDRIAWVCGQELSYHRGIESRAEGQGDIEDTALMVLSLADGTPVSFLAAWPKAAGPVDDELTVYGTEGTLRVWAWRGWCFEPSSGDAEDHACYSEDTDHFDRVRVGMAGALTEFAAAIREGRAASPSPAEVLKSQEIVEAFYQDNDATL